MLERLRIFNHGNFNGLFFGKRNAGSNGDIERLTGQGA